MRRGRTPPLRRGIRSAGKESPSHGFAVPAPFRQGGRGDGGCGLPRARCALAMTLLLQEGRYGIGGRTGASAPTGALLVVRRGGALPLPRATARVAPTEGLPTPFLHISCSLCVDFLWINFPFPFLPPSCGNPSFPLWKKNPCISRPYGGFPQKFSLRLLLLKKP